MAIPASPKDLTAAGRTALRGTLACAAALCLSACAALGSSGPSAGRIAGSSNASVQGANVQLVEVNDAIASRLARYAAPSGFADTLGDSAPVGTTINRGDEVGVTVWEAPPAVLFGMLSGSGSGAQAAIGTGRNTEIPAQMVDDRGLISLPFVGTIRAAGQTPRQLEQDIRQRLLGVANKPQVMVGIVRNASANVTVVGEVANSARVPLTARGERLLDILATVGGVRQQVDKITIQVTRDQTVATMAMDALIRDPRQNVRLRPDDVVTAIFQPFSFTSLGAAGVNAEVPFEASGITLSQALGRINGLQDSRANPKGVFIFRWEDPAALEGAVPVGAPARADGKVPVIYRVNLSDPTTFFVAQNFPVKNRDVLYVSNAPGAELQKFVSILSQTAFSIIGITNGITGN